MRKVLTLFLISSIFYLLFLKVPNLVYSDSCNCPGEDCDHCGCADVSWGRNGGCGAFCAEKPGDCARNCGGCGSGSGGGGGGGGGGSGRSNPCCIGSSPGCTDPIWGYCTSDTSCNPPANYCAPPCDPNSWGAWSACSAPCGTGTQARTNACGTVQKQECNTQSCDISYPSPTPTPRPVGYTPTPTPLNHTPTPSPTVSPSGFSPSWFKTENGDVHSNKDIIVSLPSLLERFSDFLVTVKNLSSFAARSDNDARPELASKRNWYWYSPPYGQVNYPELTGFFSYYTHNKPADKKLVVDNINNVLVNSLAGNKNLVRVQVDPTGGSVAISDSIGLSGDRQLVFYINGDLNINNNIILTDDSGIVFVVKGNLNIDASVTQADGFYLVDKVINSSYPANGNKPLVVHGAIFVSQSGKIFGNSRQNNDRATPSEKFIFEPKYLVKFSQVLGRAGIVWQEVAP